MKRFVIVLLLLAVTSGGASAQPRDCGNGLPCGAIPWTRFILPRLSSPTPMPTLNVTNQVTLTPSPTPTPTVTVTPGGPTPTPGTPTLELGELNDSVATLESVLAATPFPVNNALGTPVSPQEAFEQVGADAGQFFGFARSVLSPGTFGVLWPLVAFTFTALMIVLVVKSSTFIIPALVAAFGFIRKVIDLIRGFFLR